jgi:hypothetical protein
MLLPKDKADRLLFVFSLDDLLTAVVARRADVVPQVHFASRRLDGERGRFQVIVGPMHAAFGRRFLILLNSHVV